MAFAEDLSVVKIFLWYPSKAWTDRDGRGPSGPLREIDLLA